MRLSTAKDRDEGRGVATLEASYAAGVRLFDTAHAYALADDELGHNERLLGRTLGTASEAIVVVTKGGMRRPQGRWVPDGRRATLLAHAEASAEALGRPADLFLLHAPDPEVRITTSARALTAVVERGLAHAVGLSNVGVPLLEEAAKEMPIAAVQVALHRRDLGAVRGGVLEWARARGIPLLAHSPLGGTAHYKKVMKERALNDEAARLDVDAGLLALAWLQDLDEGVVPIVGATREETAQRLEALVRATVRLDDQARAVLDDGQPAARLARTAQRDRRPPDDADGDVVLVMGLMGAGKSELAHTLEQDGYHRLNRDEAGGRLADLLAPLDEALARGQRRVVLDNVYPTRAVRSDVIEAAWRRGVPARCSWIRTALDDALVNAAGRLLSRYGHLPTPEELKALSQQDPQAFDPRAIYRAEREMEPPSLDEGFTRIDEVEFLRRPRGHGGAALVFELEGGLLEGGLEGRGIPEVRARHIACALDEGASLAVVAWRPGRGETALAETRALVEDALRARGVAVPRGRLSVGVCTHAAGPPLCWCRKPLPGLALALLEELDADPARSTWVGPSAADRTLARRLGLAYLRPSLFDEAGIPRPTDNAEVTPTSRVSLTSS